MPITGLPSADWYELNSACFVTEADRPDAFYAIRLSELLQPNNAESLIETYARRIAAGGRDVAGVYFGSWFSGLCRAHLYLLSRRDLAADFSLENMAVELYESDRGVRMSFRVREFRAARWNGADRELWLHRAYVKFYGQQVKPLLEAVARAARIDPGQLWGQIVTQLYNAIDAMEREAADAADARTLRDDFHALAYGVNPTVFGRRRNPFQLKFRRIEHPELPNERIRVNATCCLSHKTAAADGHCYTCPRIGDEERKNRRSMWKAIPART